MVHMCRSEDDLWKLVLPSYQAGPRDQTQVVRLDHKPLLPATSVVLLGACFQDPVDFSGVLLSVLVPSPGSVPYESLPSLFADSPLLIKLDCK